MEHHGSNPFQLISATFVKEAVVTYFRRTRPCALQTWTMLVIFLAFVAIGLSGCGALPDDIFSDDSSSDGVSQRSTAQVGSSTLTLTEYVTQCVNHRTKPSGDYATSFEAVGALREMAERFEAMSPPSEVAQVHRARLRLVHQQIESLSQNPPDSIPTFGIFIEYTDPELASVWQDYNESQYTLSATTRDLLLTQGCIGTEREIRGAQPALTPEEKRSTKEYARWCSLDDLNDDGVYSTFGEVTSSFRRELARWEAMLPPTELVSFHEARMGLFRTVIEVFSSAPPDTVLNDTVRVDFVFELNYQTGAIPIFDAPGLWVRPDLNPYWESWVNAYKGLRFETRDIIRYNQSRPLERSGGICGMQMVS